VKNRAGAANRRRAGVFMDDQGGQPMDVRSIEDVAASPEHQGSVPVWWLFKPREMREETLGGHLELVSEFEVLAGGEVHPHSHPTFEFYYVITGRGLMTVEGETREIRQGDLVKIPPDAVHSLKPVSANASIRCLAFAVAVKDAPAIDYSSE
jgi:quercetin dioxygenase-like cupin family protein